MKKAVAILLTIFMIFNCVSCDFLKSHVFKHKTTAGDTTKNVEPGTEFRSDCDTDYFQCKSLEEYYDLLAQYEIPDDFVRYEQLQEFGLGEFKFFSVNSVSSFDAYDYVFIKDNHEIQLMIEHNIEGRGSFSLLYPDKANPSTNLRSYDLTPYVNDKEYRHVLKPDYVLSYIKSRTKYTYTGNYDNVKRLTSINWFSERGDHIGLYGRLYDYPENDDWVSRMLNQDTVSKAQAEFDAMLEKLD